MSRRFGLKAGLGLAAFLLLLYVASPDAVAQLLGNREAAAPPDDGAWLPDWMRAVLGWIVAQQIAFNEALRGAVAAYRDGDSLTPAIALIGLAFTYGVFHAVGPGHGKAVVASFFLARDGTILRGIVMGWLIAAVQSAVAIILVGAVGLVLDVGRIGLLNSMPTVEAGSYALVVALGLIMTVRAARGAGCGHDHGLGHAHDHGPGHGHDHAHDQKEKRLLKAEFWGAVIASGLRPCTGALIVLLFALANGIFFVGVLSAFAMGVGVAITVSAIGVSAILVRRGVLSLAGPGGGATAVPRVISVVGSLAVLAIGAVLLTGALMRIL